LGRPVLPGGPFFIFKEVPFFPLILSRQSFHPLFLTLSLLYFIIHSRGEPGISRQGRSKQPMKTTISRYMNHSHGEDSYNLTEEIAVRAVFRTIRPDYLADYFNTAFYELAGDIYAQARLVDIGLRFENNLALNLAAARKIRTRLDEHKILMIPAYIEAVVPEVSAIIASAIPTIRDPDPRRYFLERWMHHEHPEVARICREALARTPLESAPLYAKRPTHTEVSSGKLKKPDGHRRAKDASGSDARSSIPAAFMAREKSGPHKKTADPKTAARPKSRTTAPEKAHRTLSTAEADSFGYEKLISLIGRHIGDPKPEIRLKWIKLIGHIPERLDPDDEHKMRFISIGLSDPVQDICLEAIAQIEFLIHDRSKLAMLLKIIDSKSALIRSKEARTVIGSLAEDSRKLIENRASVPEKAKRAEPAKTESTAHAEAVSGSAEKNGMASSDTLTESSGDSVSGKRIRRDEQPAITEKIPAGSDRAEAGKSATAKGDEPSGADSMRADAIEPDRALVHSEDEKEVLTEIVGELDLPEEALAELEHENTPASLLIKKIAPLKAVPHVDNYFLRHSAVLHIKNIHEEELRYELYQTVLKHDPKDLVRQIAVEEARNLKREHVRPILRLGLEDPAWQVRSDALEYLLPFLSGTDEERQILSDCVNDSDYHIRQKADEKLLTMSRRSATP
jgi:hypothetical protein